MIKTIELSYIINDVGAHTTIDQKDILYVSADNYVNEVCLKLDQQINKCYKTKALQTDHIFCFNSRTYPAWNFSTITPANNSWGFVINYIDNDTKICHELFGNNFGIQNKIHVYENHFLSEMYFHFETKNDLILYKLLK